MLNKIYYPAELLVCTAILTSNSIVKQRENYKAITSVQEKNTSSEKMANTSTISETITEIEKVWEKQTNADKADASEMEGTDNDVFRLRFFQGKIKIY